MTAPQAPKIPVLTVTQLTHALKISLESTFSMICLQGEVSNVTLQSSGHLYFSLKDAQSQIAAVMFRGEVSRLRQVPKEGDQVVVKGALNIYPPKGSYQIVVRELSFAGLGDLLLKLEELKTKLRLKGWFSPEHKKPLPRFPKRIGVVTSPTGAAIQDILNVLSRRFSGFSLILYPVKVQGEGAAQEIAQAIAQFNKYSLVDVMIVGRGGGSIEDLWAFNEEIVAEAIFNSQIPIISAVGHETDHCIADYVADVRAPTPSAAAEMVIAEKAQQLHYLEQTRRRLDQSLAHMLRHQRQRLTGIVRHPLFASPQAVLGLWMQRLDNFRSETDQYLKLNLQHKRMLLEARRRQLEASKPTSQILHWRQKLAYADKALQTTLLQYVGAKRALLAQVQSGVDAACLRGLEKRKLLCPAQLLQRRLDQLFLHVYDRQKERFHSLALRLAAVNPRNVLAKGYTILFSEKDRSVITTVKSLSNDQKVRFLMCDGEAVATIDEITIKQETHEF